MKVVAAMAKPDRHGTCILVIMQSPHLPVLVYSRDWLTCARSCLFSSQTAVGTQYQETRDVCNKMMLASQRACVQVVAAGLQAGKVVGAVAKVCGGGGGGKPNQAQAGGKDGSKLAEAMELARKTVMDAL